MVMRRRGRIAIYNGHDDHAADDNLYDEDKE
jgi:hypothetical protein